MNPDDAHRVGEVCRVVRVGQAPDGATEQGDPRRDGQGGTPRPVSLPDIVA
jgi:hypothetical protein